MLVEDDVDIERTMSRALRGSGYNVVTAGNGSEARALLLEAHPDLIILDLILPDTDGLILTTSFRTITDAPILICSARHKSIDRVLGLKLGAADFVAKPFDLDELEARIEALLRRAARGSASSHGSSSASLEQIVVGDMVIIPVRGTVRIGGKLIHLTPTEYRLLTTLATQAEDLHSRESLGQQVWGYHDLGSGHLIDVHIGRLRLKLRQAGDLAPAIVAVRGRGYRLVPRKADLSKTA
jgi:DNA-binding response OmpR family regulator